MPKKSEPAAVAPKDNWSTERSTQIDASRRSYPSTPLLLGAPLLFMSGACGLIFQVCWFREFRLVFGASTAASSTVLAVFMGGLGLGNLILGSRVDRTAKAPLWIYGALELSVALTVAISPFLVDGLHYLYFLLGGQQSMGILGATVLRVLISILVMGLPTFLMGGTLPAMVRAVTSVQDRQRHSAAILYGINTLGAVVGALGSTFFLIQTLGTRTTLWLACMANATTASSALLIWWRQSQLANRTFQTDQTKDLEQPIKARNVVRPPTSIVYSTSFLAGFSFFLMELVWYRMLGPILGGTTFTFGLILAIALAGIGIGAAVYAVIFSGDRRVTIASLAMICVMEACFILLPFALGDEVALLAARLRGGNTSQFAGEVLGWLTIVSIVVFPAALISGIQFPMLIAMLGEGQQDIGKEIGRTFVWNTAGSILGSFAGGFGLLPLLSAPFLWKLTGLMLVGQAVVLGILAFRTTRTVPGLVATGILAIVGAGLSSQPGPSSVWRHSGIGVGRGVALQTLQTPNACRAWQNQVRRSIVWEAEGVESSVAIHATDSLSFFVNGKSDGNAIYDAGTQIMLGLIGGALHPEPHRAFVVGLGTGETAGWLTQIPSVDRVDIVELEPAIQEMARRCSAVNHDVLNHQKTRLIYNDAREVLLTTADHYDLIVCEPSNPYRSGIATLFTREFYHAGKDRLNQDGLFVQWIQAYETDEQTMRTVFATFKSVFPNVEVWETQHDDFVLLGSLQPINCSTDSLRRSLNSEPFHSALLAAWHTKNLEGFLAHYVGGKSLVDQFIASGPFVINTDDRNDIEYAFARTVGTSNASTAKTLHRIAAERDDERRPLAGAEIDWSVVDLERQWFAQKELEHPDRITALDPVLVRCLAKDYAGMLAAWETSGRRAFCLKEAVLVAWSYAIAGNPAAEKLAAQLQPDLPTEAEMIRAILDWKQNRIDRAATRLESAILQLRSQPFITAIVRESVFDAAIAIAMSNSQNNARMLKMFASPFAVLVADESRRDCACLLAASGPASAAVPFLESYEPYTTWTKRFLTFRKQVYTKLHHRLARQAERDLETFDRNAATVRASPDRATR